MDIPRKMLSAPALIALALAGGCEQSPEPEPGANTQGHTEPSPATIEANQAVLEKRPFDNKADFERARRGLIAQDDELIVADSEGGTAWDRTAYDFIDAEGENAPGSVNPSLWRQAALNNIHGLFEVTDGVYQLRGYDLSTMSLIEGDEGWIVVDPLTVKETASEAFLFAQERLGDKPVKAILFTHSHMDHFGGVKGITQHLSEKEREALRIIAPEGFTSEVTSENLMVGPAMGRRAMYMYGSRLARNERGHVGSGLGKAPAADSYTFMEPTERVRKTGTEMTIDGVPFVFQMVSGSEAPAEFTFYLPEHKAFCGAELVSRNMHNLYTLRGAKVRDARKWAGFIEEARTRFSDAEIYFGSHHWPVWGQEQINEFLTEQRDTYKYIHDQSVRMVNQGLTPSEIADRLTLPESLNEAFHNQGYYGTVKHNARAIYQAYMGWFTGNPAELDALPEPEAAKRYVEMMGGVQAVLDKARKQFESAANMDPEEATTAYRWLAELLNHAVLAEPGNVKARGLLANVYDQLGYQAESGPWRDFYLSGAYELRHGGPGEESATDPSVLKDIMMETPVPKLFDSMAARLNAEEAAGEDMTILVTFTDRGESYLLTLANSVLHQRQVAADTEADATMKLTHPMFVRIMVGEVGLKEVLFSDDLEFEGSELDLISFFTMLEAPQGTFNIVTP